MDKMTWGAGTGLRNNHPARDIMQAPGSLLYQNLFGGGQEAAQTLRQLGIPGIKYKDAGSRAADGGTHNYVVFDDSLINNLGPQP